MKPSETTSGILAGYFGGIFPGRGDLFVSRSWLGSPAASPSALPLCASPQEERKDYDYNEETLCSGSPAP